MFEIGCTEVVSFSIIQGFSVTNNPNNSYDSWDLV